MPDSSENLDREALKLRLADYARRVMTQLQSIGVLSITAEIVDRSSYQPVLFTPLDSNNDRQSFSTPNSTDAELRVITEDKLLDDWLDSTTSKPLCILGEAGLGKSCVIESLCLRLATALQQWAASNGDLDLMPPVPIVVRLHRVTRGIRAAITQPEEWFFNDERTPALSPRDIDFLVNTNRIVYMFDGYDQVSPAYLDVINHELRITSAKMRCLWTSRPGYGAERLLQDPTVSVCTINAISLDVACQYVESRHRDVLAFNAAYEGPLAGYLNRWLHVKIWCDSFPPPQDVGQLFHLVYRRFPVHRGMWKNPPLDEEADDFRGWFSTLAFEFAQSGFEPCRLNHADSNSPAFHPNGDRGRNFLLMATNAGLLVRDPQTGLYVLPKIPLVEYLIALHVADRVDTDPIARQRFVHVFRRWVWRPDCWNCLRTMFLLAATNKLGAELTSELLEWLNSLVSKQPPTTRAPKTPTLDLRYPPILLAASLQDALLPSRRSRWVVPLADALLNTLDARQRSNDKNVECDLSAVNTNVLLAAINKLVCAQTDESQRPNREAECERIDAELLSSVTDVKDIVVPHLEVLFHGVHANVPYTESATSTGGVEARLLQNDIVARIAEDLAKRLMLHTVIRGTFPLGDLLRAYAPRRSIEGIAYWLSLLDSCDSSSKRHTNICLALRYACMSIAPNNASRFLDELFRHYLSLHENACSAIILASAIEVLLQSIDFLDPKCPLTRIAFESTHSRDNPVLALAHQELVEAVAAKLPGSLAQAFLRNLVQCCKSEAECQRSWSILKRNLTSITVRLTNAQVEALALDWIGQLKTDIVSSHTARTMCLALNNLAHAMASPLALPITTELLDVLHRAPQDGRKELWKAIHSTAKRIDANLASETFRGWLDQILSSAEDRMIVTGLTSALLALTDTVPNAHAIEFLREMRDISLRPGASRFIIDELTLVASAIIKRLTKLELTSLYDGYGEAVLRESGGDIDLQLLLAYLRGASGTLPRSQVLYNVHWFIHKLHGNSFDGALSTNVLTATASLIRTLAAADAKELLVTLWAIISGEIAASSLRNLLEVFGQCLMCLGQDRLGWIDTLLTAYDHLASHIVSPSPLPGIIERCADGLDAQAALELAQHLVNRCVRTAPPVACYSLFQRLASAAIGCLDAQRIVELSHWLCDQSPKSESDNPLDMLVIEMIKITVARLPRDEAFKWARKLSAIGWNNTTMRIVDSHLQLAVIHAAENGRVAWWKDHRPKLAVRLRREMILEVDAGGSDPAQRPSFLRPMTIETAWSIVRQAIPSLPAVMPHERHKHVGDLLNSLIPEESQTSPTSCDAPYMCLLDLEALLCNRITREQLAKQLEEYTGAQSAVEGRSAGSQLPPIVEQTRNKKRICRIEVSMERKEIKLDGKIVSRGSGQLCYLFLTLIKANGSSVESEILCPKNVSPKSTIEPGKRASALLNRAPRTLKKLIGGKPGVGGRWLNESAFQRC